MPTYSYECRKCGDVFDVFHRMTETPRIKCGACGGGTRKLLGTGAGIIFKGSGFYETDFKAKKGAPPAEAKSDGVKSDSASSTGGDTAAKPATATEAKPAAASKAAAAKNN